MALIAVLGIPVGNVSYGVWFLWALFSAYGIVHARSALRDLDDRFALWISILATLLVLGGFIRYGLFNYLGSPAPDGWSYVSFGEYLRHYPKGTEGGLAPIYQYASHLSGTRYAASAMLAALVPPWSTWVDTQMTVGPLLILSVFSFASSLAYVARIANQRGLDVSASLVIILGVVAGWVPYALNANNYDNLLALALAPVLFGLALDQTLKNFGRILLPAIFISASIYIYPELSPLIMAAYGVVALESFFSDSKYQAGMDKRILLTRYVGITVIALIIVSPYLQNVIHFFLQQLASSDGTRGRPGEGMMPSLVDGAHVVGAMWGLEGTDWGIVGGVLLAQIFLFGVGAALVKRHFSLILYLALIGVLLSVMIILKHYDYGAYKILLMSWWASAIILAAGIKVIWNIPTAFTTAGRNAARIVIVVFLLGIVSVSLTRQYIWIHRHTDKTATEAREARDAVLKIPGAIQVSVSDPILNNWLVYQLRDAKALFTHFYGYMDMPHVRPLIARSMVPKLSEIKFLLTDIDRATVGVVVWKNKSLKLTKGNPEQQPPDIAIHAPNGREKLGGMPFFWLGREAASIILTTPKSTVVRIDFEDILGPSVDTSAKDPPKVSIESSGRQLLVFDTKSAKHSILISLSRGSNTLVFSPDYSGSVVPNSNGDPRILLVGIKLTKISTND